MDCHAEKQGVWLDLLRRVRMAVHTQNGLIPCNTPSLPRLSLPLSLQVRANLRWDQGIGACDDLIVLLS